MQNQKIKDKKKRSFYIKNENKIYVNFGGCFLKKNLLSPTKERMFNLNRVVNRCGLTIRSRSVLRKYKLARGSFRRLASFGFIPGVRKSSW